MKSKESMVMKLTIGMIFMLSAMPLAFSQSLIEDEGIRKLSLDKWHWMADKKVEILDALFHEKSVFVHMGGTWGKTEELEVIKNGGIWYKKADVHDVSVNIIDNTAILLNKITLLAVVGGNEVTNNFMVTEVYQKEGNRWLLLSLSFTKLI